jgi:formamidase
VTQFVRIDRSKRLREQPETGHNRWHPDIPPIIEVGENENIVIDTQDASDGQVTPATVPTDFEAMDQKVSHPLSGPIYVSGAVPGDLLEIEYVDIFPQPYGWTRFRPGAGFLRDVFTEPFVAHWDIEHGYATSQQVPGVRVPDGSFMGTAGLAPSHEQLDSWTARENELLERGGNVQPPDIQDAVPGGRIGEEGLRTGPPRENAGNMDVKQLTRGSRLYIPVAVEGGLFSVGDGHFAQGDGEVCITAIEMGATVSVRFTVHKGEAARRRIVTPRFAHPGYFLPPQTAVPRNFTATVGYPIRQDGTQEGEDVTLAARNALLAMIDLLVDRGYTSEQAYVICSVAVDLKISNIVDLPNVTVSAFLPEDIFV